MRGRAAIWIVVAFFLISWVDSAILINKFWSVAKFSHFWAVLLLLTYPLPCVLMFAIEEHRGLAALAAYLPLFFAIRMFFSP
jgi:hypothetical protein